MRTLLYFAFVQATLLIPGYTIVARSRLLARKPGIELCAGYMTSIALLAVFALASYVFDIPHLWIQILCWAVIALSCFFFVRHKLYRAMWELRFPVAACVAMSLFALL